MEEPTQGTSTVQPEVLPEGAPGGMTAAKEPPAPLESLGPVEVVLAWSGIGGLHRSYFSDSQAVEGLASSLGEGLQGGTVVVEIGWDQEKHRGTIQAQLGPSNLRGGLELPQGGVALGRLVPVTQALARYRDDVAGRYDIRVLSFHLEVQLGGACEVRAVGEHPPDGNEVSPCVHVGAEEFCGTQVTGGVQFQSDNASIQRCFGLSSKR